MNQPHEEILRTVYADLSRLRDYASAGIVLHRADGAGEVRGVQAVAEYEEALLTATGHTLVMDVQHIAAGQYFGAVLGVLRAHHPQVIAMPFCGLWRFQGGRIVEHWENAYDPELLTQLLTP